MFVRLCAAFVLCEESRLLTPSRSGSKHDPISSYLSSCYERRNEEKKMVRSIFVVVGKNIHLVSKTYDRPPVRRAGFVTRPAPGVPKCRSRSLLPLVLLVHTTTALSFRIHTRAERSTSPRVCPMFALRRAAARAVAARGSFNPQRVALRAFAAQCPHDPSKPYHKSPLPLDAAGGLLEYSVVYTDRAMNHMSKPFCKVRHDVRAFSRRAASARSALRCLPDARLARVPEERA